MKAESVPDIVYYDGYCNLCHSAINFIKRYDQGKRLVFIPLQQFHSSFFKDNDNEFTTIVFSSGNVIFTKSDAILQIAKRLKQPISWLYIFIILPKFIRDRLYDFVAKNRFKWFGRCSVCQ